MKIGIVQNAAVWEDKSRSRLEIENILSVQTESADILIFPEMTLTGFTMNADRIAENIPGESTDFFAGLAKQYATAIIGGVVEKQGNAFYNCAVYINKAGEILGTYRKIHPFSYAGEDKNYASGKETAIINDQDINIGLSICYDLRFPELYRRYGKQRTELIINIANWPIKRIEHWKTLLKARAIENLCFVVGTNRIGEDPLTIYNGASMVFSPTGNLQHEQKEEEKFRVIEIAIPEVAATRTRFPFLEDIRLI